LKDTHRITDDHIIMRGYLNILLGMATIYLIFLDLEAFIFINHKFRFDRLTIMMVLNSHR
jgi:hypothetical protein